MKKLLCVALILLLLCGCNAVPAIEQMPYPESNDGRIGIEMDYSSAESLQEQWDVAELVVVGYYENVAPTSENIARDLDDITKESPREYFETLVYQFKVVEVLKGTLDESTIPLGLFHGQKTGGVSYPYKTFKQPDLTSYKVLFLDYNEINEYYYPWASDWWLSTDQAVRQPVKTDWTTLTFVVEDTIGCESERILNLFEDRIQSTYQAEAEPDSTRHVRTSYTGAELLALAESANE